MFYWGSSIASSSSSSVYPDTVTSERSSSPEMSRKARKAGRTRGKRKEEQVQHSDYTVVDGTIVYRTETRKDSEYSTPLPPLDEKIALWIDTLPSCSGDYVSASIPPTPKLDIASLPCSPRSPSPPHTLSPSHNPLIGRLSSSCPEFLGNDEGKQRVVKALLTRGSHMQSRDRIKPHYTHETHYPHRIASHVGNRRRSSSQSDTSSSQRGVYCKQPRYDWTLERYMQNFVGHYIVCAGCGQIVQAKDFEKLHDDHCPDDK